MAGGSNVVAPSRVTFEPWYDMGLRSIFRLNFLHFKLEICYYMTAVEGGRD